MSWIVFAILRREGAQDSPYDCGLEFLRERHNEHPSHKLSLENGNIMSTSRALRGLGIRERVFASDSTTIPHLSSLDAPHGQYDIRNLLLVLSHNQPHRSGSCNGLLQLAMTSEISYSLRNPF